MMKRALSVAAAAVLGGAAPAFCGTGAEYHYMVLCGYQDGLNSPASSHTFAVFAETEPMPARRLLAVHTISWLPRDLSFTALDRAEPGYNFDLPQTLGIAAAQGLQVLCWGPYPVANDLYGRAATQAGRLREASASGRILYKAMDGRTRRAVWEGRPGGAINCIHAVSDMAGYRETGALRGYAATERVLRFLWPWVLEPVPQPWLMPLLGLGDLPSPGA